MERCKAPEPMHETLTDLHYGLLDADAERVVRLHIDTCEACASQYAALAQLTGALRIDEAFPHEESVNWEQFARATVRRSMAPEPSVLTAVTGVSAVSTWAGWLRRVIPAPVPVWAGAAAGILLLVGAGLVAGRFMGGGPSPLIPDTSPLIPDNGEMASVFVPEANIDNLTVSLARQNTAEYLRQTRAMLVSVLDVNIDCDKGKVDVSAERAKATELLRRQRLIATELHRMPLARAQGVCDDLEKLLIEVASLTDCTRSDEIQSLRDLVEKRQILMRMELLGQELSRVEGASA